ncbi:MAG: putative TPR repeat methyltransferase [Paracoccaceae bacterium]|jgi:predicted TPR repeat methyltransferase
MTDKQFLDHAYGLDGYQKTKEFYTDWAESYDTEVTSNGYVTPARCADALLQFAPDKSLSILDFGCGTGISGAALAAEGFSNIIGTDLNDAMLSKARELKGVYKDVVLSDEENSFDFEPGTYDCIAAIGVIGSGAAPVECFDSLMGCLAPDGLFVFSYNDHTLEDPAFEGRISNYVDSGAAELLFKEYGPHLPAREMNSNVYILKRR